MAIFNSPLRRRTGPLDSFSPPGSMDSPQLIPWYLERLANRALSSHCHQRRIRSLVVENSARTDATNLQVCCTSDVMKRALAVDDVARRFARIERWIYFSSSSWNYRRIGFEVFLALVSWASWMENDDRVTWKLMLVCRVINFRNSEKFRERNLQLRLRKIKCNFALGNSLR